jgi:hypothetical protein
MVASLSTGAVQRPRISSLTGSRAAPSARSSSWRLSTTGSARRDRALHDHPAGQRSDPLCSQSRLAIERKLVAEEVERADVDSEAVEIEGIVQRPLERVDDAVAQGSVPYTWIETMWACILASIAPGPKRSVIARVAASVASARATGPRDSSMPRRGVP